MNPRRRHDRRGARHARHRHRVDDPTAPGPRRRGGPMRPGDSGFSKRLPS